MSIWKQVVMRCGEEERFFSPFVILPSFGPRTQKTSFFATRRLFLCLCIIFCPRRVRTISSDFPFFAPLSEPTRTESEEERNPFFVVPPIPRETDCILRFPNFDSVRFRGFNRRHSFTLPSWLSSLQRGKGAFPSFRASFSPNPPPVCYSKGIPPLP